MTSRGAWQKLVSEKEIFPKSVSELSQQQNCQMTTQIVICLTDHHRSGN
jgi:hypothetical protein